MARKKRNLERTMINVDKDTFDQVATIITDPKSGRLAYGTLSKIVEKLLRQWLKAFHDSSDPKEFLRNYDQKLVQNLESKEKNTDAA